MGKEFEVVECLLAKSQFGSRDLKVEPLPREHLLSEESSPKDLIIIIGKDLIINRN